MLLLLLLLLLLFLLVFHDAAFDKRTCNCGIKIRKKLLFTPTTCGVPFDLKSTTYLATQRPVLVPHYFDYKNCFVKVKKRIDTNIDMSQFHFGPVMFTILRYGVRSVFGMATLHLLTLLPHRFLTV